MTAREPKFCNKCRTELLVTEVNHEYDVFSGDPIRYTKTFTCPNYGKMFLSKKSNGHYMEVISSEDKFVNKIP